LSADTLLRLKGICKNYGGVKAVQDVDLEVDRHEILALVGDNGAGKSTLVKVISGAISPDAGAIYFDGEPVLLKSPRDAAALGIQMCYQDLALVDCLDVAQNIFLGREMCSRLFGVFHILHLKRMRVESVNHLKELGVGLQDARAKVKNLSGGQRQVIGISRAVYWGTKLVILDEPTAALGVRESKRVNELILTLKQKNIAVVVISHNLEHVFSVADRVVVLRHGRIAGDRVIKDTTGDEIVKMITGAEHT
jgi:ABC-type sugar transport system ATPase subunit